MRSTLLKKGIRELWQHKIQYTMLVIILSLGVGMYNSMYDFMDSRVLTIDSLYDECHFMDIQVSFQYGLNLEKEDADDIITKSRIAPDISDIEYRLIIDAYINISSDESYTLTKGLIYGYEYFSDNGRIKEIKVNNPLFYDQDIKEFRVNSEESCYLEKGFAEFYGLQEEDTLKIQYGNKEFELDVLELINMPDYLQVLTEGSMFPNPAALGVMVVPIKTANNILNDKITTNHINDIIIRLNSNSNIEDVKRWIEDAFKESMIPVEIIEKDDNPARASIIEDMEGDQQLIGIFPVIIFVISGIGLVLALRRLIKTQRSQIGVFKALGVDDKSILLYFLIIGLIIAILSIIFGYLISIPLNSSFMLLLDEIFDFAIIKYSTSWQYYIFSAIISIILCLSCTLIPAYLAVKVKPIDVIQKREGIGKKNLEKSHFNFDIIKKMPTPFKIIFRDISRKPLRQITTIFGVALSLSLFMSFVILSDSFFLFLDESNEINKWDYEISMNSFIDTTNSWNWSKTESSIEYVNPGIILPMTFNISDEEINAVVYSLDDLEKSFDIGFAGEAGDGIIISEYISNKFNIYNGDIVEIEIPRLEDNSGFSFRKVQVRVVGIHSNPIGLFIYSDLSYIQRLTNLKDMANIFYIHSFNNELSQSIKNRISTIEGVTSLSFVSDRDSNLYEMFEIMMTMIYLLMLISSTLAAAIVYNLFMISASEKRREYATMKTLGTSQLKIGYLIFIEAAVTLLGGIIFGSFGGYLLGYYMFMSTSVIEEFTIKIIFSWSGFLMGSIMLSLVVSLVSMVTLRYIKKINIADVIRDRSS